MCLQPPVGWIPPESREIIYGERTPEDIAIIKQTAGMFDEETGKRRPLTDEEIESFGIRPIIGVRDTRTGEIH